MSDHNHTGTIWGNVGTGGVNRHSDPTQNPATIITPSLHAGQNLIVLCYALGDPESFANPTDLAHPFSSNAWDFVVTSDQDSGSYVADVFVDTGGDIRQQLGTQGTCDALRQRLMHSPLG